MEAAVPAKSELLLYSPELFFWDVDTRPIQDYLGHRNIGESRAGARCPGVAQPASSRPPRTSPRAITPLGSGRPCSSGQRDGTMADRIA